MCFRTCQVVVRHERVCFYGGCIVMIGVLRGFVVTAALRRYVVMIGALRG